MIREIKKSEYPQLLEIWESAVLNTHDFLKEEDFSYYKQQIPQYFEHVKLLGFEYENKLIGFMGVAEENLEMLFIHNDYRGKGIGKELLNYGINNLNIKKVDVNEQNKQAVDFYIHMGFQTIKRLELDAEGKEYPILNMILPDNIKE